MPRGQTESPYDLDTRKELAYRRFAQGYRNTQIAAEIQVTPDTVARYRAAYELDISDLARSNPRMLQDVVANTLRSLNEIDLVRHSAWERIEQGGRTELIECDNCEHEVEVQFPISDQNRNSLLSTILKAQDQRAKIYGVFGVKAEFLQQVANVKIVQELLIDWMRANLCATDRAALEQFMLTELREYMGEEGAPNTIEVTGTQLAELASAAQVS